MGPGGVGFPLCLTGLTRQHVGILLTIAGTAFLAFSVNVKRQYGDKGPLREAVDRAKREGNLMELTETSISVRLFWTGLLCVAVGTLLQW
jgi:hypothetical protein